MHDHVEDIEKEQSRPAMDLEEPREPLPVFPPQRGSGTRVIRRAKRPRLSIAHWASDPSQRGEIRHQGRLLGNADLEGGIEKQRVGPGEVGLGLVEFVEHPEVAFEQFLAADLKRDHVGAKLGRSARSSRPSRASRSWSGVLGIALSIPLIENEIRLSWMNSI